MASRIHQSSRVWTLSESQHGVVTRAQLLGAGWSAAAIRHAVDAQRLHPLFRGVYAVGRPTLGRRGVWLAAVLSSGPDAVLSHSSASAAWGIDVDRAGPIEISVPVRLARLHPGVTVHRRGALLELERREHDGIPITSPAMTLLDIAPKTSWAKLERAVNRADALDLIDPETLRSALRRFRRYPGVAKLRALLDRDEFVLTSSELERLFSRIARSAGLPLPLREEEVNGFAVDFFWPDLGLIVETDGLRYHRTAASQTRDRLRDQAHTASGLTPLRFTHHQVRYQPGYVRARLMQTVRHLSRDGRNDEGLER